MNAPDPAQNLPRTEGAHDVTNTRDQPDHPGTPPAPGPAPDTAYGTSPDQTTTHPPADGDTTKAPSPESTDGKAKPGKAGTDSRADSSQASRLVALAIGRYNLVQGQDGRVYAVDRDGPNIALPLRGRDGLRQRLARAYYQATGVAAGGSALADALTVIEGMATDAPTERVGLRVARRPTGTIVVDLGEATGRAIVIHPGSWHLAESSPVLFRRTTLTSTLPVPTAPGTGDLTAFRELLNVDEAGFHLIVAWLVAALIPDIPHPILALLGEQGTAKSTAASFAVRLIDPSPAPLRTPPKDIRAWSVTATASWTVALDNVSTIAAWFSDTLCKAVTGDGIVDRALYTDDDVTVLAFRRVIALTSIDAGALAGDLAERLLPIELQVIPAAERRPEAEIEEAFTAAAPATLAALLDLAAAVTAALPGIELDQLPRMADFARLLAALDDVTGWHTLPDYLAATADTNHAVLDADPFAVAVTDLVTGQAIGWTGTAADLLETITPDHPPKKWPTTPRAASGALRRIAPALRAAGIGVWAGKSAGQRLIRLTPPHENPAEDALPGIETPPHFRDEPK
jgi:hypothetical protein